MNEKKSREWSRLDNAGKLFPPTSGRRDPKVFRFACELFEGIEPELLQTALDYTIEAFPFYRSVLRRGLFWYYLDQSDRKPRIHPEDRPICAPLYDKSRKNLLFSVSYYGCRINLEVYHALSDGTGALQFLRCLTAHYLALAHPDAFPNGAPVIDYDASFSEQKDDSFQKYYTEQKTRLPARSHSAFVVGGGRLSEYRLRVVEGHCSAKAALALARSHQVSITVYLAAVLLCAIDAERTLRGRRRPIVLSVPVNLRNFFPSASARNFFGTIDVGHLFTAETVFEEVLASVSAQFAEQLTAERLLRRMNEFSALEHNAFARVIPLAAKDMVMLLAHRMKKRAETAALSNVGRVAMPEDCKGYIKQFDVFNSTNQINICICSFGDRMVLSMTLPFVSAQIPKHFFRMLATHGLPLEIHTNQPETDSKKGHTQETDPNQSEPNPKKRHPKKTKTDPKKEGL